jgi:hypothetical protein
MNAYRSLAKIFAACVLAAGIAACGSSGGSGNNGSSTPPSSTSSAPATSSSTPSGSGTAATITKNWETFFNGKTPVPTRVSLLQDGSQFPQASLASNSLSSGASAKVLSVSGITSASATVKYNILLDGTPALKNQVGTAVLQDGTWKVGIANFCNLLKLEGFKPFPPVCKTAS